MRSPASLLALLATAIGSPLALSQSLAPAGATDAFAASSSTLRFDAGPTCPDWQPGFGLERSDSATYCYATFDDGTGPALYAAGAFRWIGGARVRLIARWDGNAWHALGNGPLGDGLEGHRVNDLAVFDDGSGPALYACGLFTTASGISNIARWDGASWSALANGIDGPAELQVFDDGSGPALYAVGGFTRAGTFFAPGIARWDGLAWSPVGSGPTGTDGSGACVTVHDDGSGLALYVAGRFPISPPDTATVWRWDGLTWRQVGGGMRLGGVSALRSYDDGGGAQLYAAGSFLIAGNTHASRIARWNGNGWHQVGAGTDGGIDRLEVYDDGTGLALYAGGDFTSAGGSPAANVARWDGATWTDIGGTTDRVLAFGLFDSGSGTELHVGGRFVGAGGIATFGFARWNGASWSGTGVNADGLGMDGTVWALASGPDPAGGGERLFAGGDFRAAGQVAASGVAAWDGSNWHRLGDGLRCPPDSGEPFEEVNTLSLFDDGSGLALYAGGWFCQAGDIAAHGVARWDGAEWSPVGSDFVRAWCFAVHDDGTGPALYAGGFHRQADGSLEAAVCRWDGQDWIQLGESADGLPSALVSYDDGSGAKLYAGGLFSNIGGMPAERLACWDGSAWHEVGGGVSGYVHTFLVHDDGRGPALFVGGNFSAVGGLTSPDIARWDGSAWSDLDGGIPGTSIVLALATFDDGTGAAPALFAAGRFDQIGAVPASNLARWDGSSWSAVSGGLDDFVRSLAAYEAGSGAVLFVGGAFSRADSRRSSRIAMLRRCDEAGAPYCFGDGSGSPCPCGNEANAGHGCANSTGDGARLESSGSSSIAQADLVLSASGLPPHQPVLYLQGESASNAGAGAPFGDGLRCVGGAVVRMERALSNGAGLAHTHVDLALAGGVAPGERRFYQLYLRDPQLGPCGAGFNLSNGLRVDWTP